MEKKLIIDFPIEEIIKRITEESTERILKKINFQLIHEKTSKENEELTRKQTAEYLAVSPPTVDRYTDEGLLKKYGSGKRARYLLHEVEAAKPAIMESLNKWCSPSRKINSK
ncbi:MAG: helix-turn-helix domain-containing protein [bacterium]